jgi:hypothetical protein
MLRPTNRLTLIDAMRPPPGYMFDQAMAVTFTLDLRALLAAPAAFALSRPVDVEHGEARAEPIELIHAIRANADRITVFSQAGEIALPPSRRVFAFLERSIVPVTAPRGGIVHPKLWVLRYVNPGGDDSQLRVLSASRNLTFDTSWDTVLRLDTTDYGDREHGVGLEPVAELFETLAQRSVGRLDEAHRDRVASLGTDLRERRFAVPGGVDDLYVHVLGTGPKQGPLPTTADRSLVISPFVSDDFLAKVHPTHIDELVSRAEHLDALTPELAEGVGALYSFDDGSTSELDSRADLAPSDPAQPLRGLHAKIFAFEGGERARVFCGSANATGAAFEVNVEVLVELVGPLRTLGIDALCDGAGDEMGLRALFVPHRRAPEAELETDDPLASVRRGIGGLEITGQVDESGPVWAVTYTSTAPLPVTSDLAVECWPLPSPGNRRPVPTGAPLSVRFETSLEGISGFLVFELTDPTGTKTHCVVPAQLDDVPEERDRQLLRNLIGNADRFLRYLLALLSDTGEDFGLADVLDEVTREQPDPANGRAGPGLPVLEYLLRTLRTDPGRLLALDPLVTDLAADDALPTGFADLWHELRTVTGHRRTP